MGYMGDSRNSSLEWLPTDQKKQIVKFCEEVLERVAHGHIHCRLLQLVLYYRVLTEEMKLVSSSLASGFESEESGSTRHGSVFEFKSVFI